MKRHLLLMADAAEGEGETKPKQPRGKKGGVKVKALRPIAEEVDGEVERFATGEVFTIDEDRLKALAGMVERC